MKTFQELCPKWFKALQKEEATLKMCEDMDDPQFCIVGEAYGFNGKYQKQYNEDYCKECDRYCMRFHDHLQLSGLDDYDTQIIYRPDKIQAMILKFMGHWNKKHEEKKI